MQAYLITFSCVGPRVSVHVCANAEINLELLLFLIHCNVGGAEISSVNNTTKASVHFFKELGNLLDSKGALKSVLLTAPAFMFHSSVFAFVDSGLREIHSPGEEGQV